MNFYAGISGIAKGTGEDLRVFPIERGNAIQKAGIPPSSRAYAIKKWRWSSRKIIA